MNPPEPRRLPDFIGVGPPRTATTWLYEVMQGHVGFSDFRKETDFFTRFYGRGIDWYLQYFAACPRDLPMGEMSPLYFASDDARERIQQAIARCRIICSFRDPVDRAWSHWRLLARSLRTRLDFEQAVERLRDIRETSRYGHYAAKWIESFGRENVLLLFYEDLERDPQGFVDSVCDFIGAPRFALNDSPAAATRVHSVPSRARHPALARNVRNAIGWLNDRRMHRAARLIRTSRLWRYAFEGGEAFARPSPEAAARIRAALKPEIEALERISGRDLSAWKTGGARGQKQNAG
ncbi:MAG TPA: sulfotransferase domain-containing protein [Candidatus Binataceae bacterium]|nr:sulfotransferase domain-containing protein [Candidatus Binataceae bacterium]